MQMVAAGLFASLTDIQFPEFHVLNASLPFYEHHISFIGIASLYTNFDSPQECWCKFIVSILNH